jgi:predicted metal-dependent hydrolase
MLSNDAETIALAVPGAVPLQADCPVRWRRSARARRVSLRIDARSGSVVVTLPPRAGRRQGMALLSTHAAWVAERLAALSPHIPLEPGVELPLGGAPHVIRHQPGSPGGAWLEPGAIVVAGDEEFLARRILDFLKAEARRRIMVLSRGHAATLGVKVRGVRLKDTRSRWGSCAPDGTLAFSWRLVMAPDWVLDYVVAHEVAHLRELNHSERFWVLVAQLTPHRDAAVAWLRENGPGLLRVG